MTIIDLRDPFPGAETVALEVTPAGPYAVFRRPWSTTAIPSQPASFGGLLGHGAVPYRDEPIVGGIRFTATVSRMSSARWAFNAPMGTVYLRGFDREGKRLWTGTFSRVHPFETARVGGHGVVTTFDLLGPFTVVED